MAISPTTTISHPTCFDISTGKTLTVSSYTSINQCLGLLFTSAKGELLSDPDFGTNLFAYILEPNDLMLRDMVVDDILYAVNKYEKRITMSESDINITSTRDYVVISVNYFIKKTGDTETFEVTLDRGDYNEF